MERKKPQRLYVAKHRISTGQNRIISYILLLTFAFAGRAPGDVRLFVDVKYITSNELGDFRFIFLIQMEFTYILRQFNIPILPEYVTYPQ